LSRNGVELRMLYYNTPPNTNRETRRKVEKYRRKHPNLSFTQAYNQLFGTNYDEIYKNVDTSMSTNNDIILSAETDTRDLSGNKSIVL